MDHEAALAQRLLAAKQDLRLPRELAKLSHVACLILDDISYVQHDRDEMEVPFTLLSDRYALCLTEDVTLQVWLPHQYCYPTLLQISVAKGKDMVRSSMSVQAKRERLTQIAGHYREATGMRKSQILDEFVAARGYVRKYAIRLLYTPPPSAPRVTRPRPRRSLATSALDAGCTTCRLARDFQAEGIPCKTECPEAAMAFKEFSGSREVANPLVIGRIIGEEV